MRNLYTVTQKPHLKLLQFLILFHLPPTPPLSFPSIPFYLPFPLIHYSFQALLRKWFIFFFINQIISIEVILIQNSGQLQSFIQMSKDLQEYHHLDIYESDSLKKSFEKFQHPPKEIHSSIPNSTTMNNAEPNSKTENVSVFQPKKMKKTNWSMAEDTMLREIIGENGACNWAEIASKIKTRTGKQCRERWHNHLRDGVNKNEWEVHEYWILALCVKAFGKKWSSISKYLPGRTDNTIKNQWNCKMKILKTDFEEKITKLIENPNLRRKLSQKEKSLFSMIESNEEVGTPSNPECTRIKKLQSAMKEYQKVEDEIKTMKKMKEEVESEEGDLSWRNKAIQGGEELFEEQNSQPLL